MNRVIKFKGKSVDSSEWIKGYYYKECDNTYIIEDRQKVSMLNRNEAVLIDPDTVCQFTGFLDNNGKEIYEGDVLNIGPAFCAVVWVESLGGFFLQEDCAKLPGVKPLGEMLRRYDHEVIGNIHDDQKGG